MAVSEQGVDAVTRECDCEESRRLGMAKLITQHMPEGWQQMDYETRRYFLHITCFHCGKILRYGNLPPQAAARTDTTTN